MAGLSEVLLLMFEGGTTRVRLNQVHSSLDYCDGLFVNDWKPTPGLLLLLAHVYFQDAEAVILTCKSRECTMRDRMVHDGKCIVGPLGVVGHTLARAENVDEDGLGGGRLPAWKSGHTHRRNRCEQVVVLDERGRSPVRIHIQGTHPLSGRRIVSWSG